MKYYGNTLCIPANEIIASDRNPDGVISMTTYKNWCNRGKLRVVKRGANGSPALVEYDSSPEPIRMWADKRYKNPQAAAETQPFLDLIVRDKEAVEFFTDKDNPIAALLTEKHISQYVNDASILNAFTKVIKNVNKHKASGAKVRKFWPKAVEAVKAASDKWPNTLPTSASRLKAKYESYMTEGYPALISRKFGNDNAQKVTALVEKMILSIYAMPNKPFAASVHDLYLQFLHGTIEVVDKSTGEFFNRDDFRDRNGNFIEISESTVWNYLNNPANRPLVDKSRLDWLDYNNTHRPHARRHAPNYSFSKISMDDRDLPRKLAGRERVKAYYAYDVASGAVIGAAYSRSKDEGLFIDCMRDMFRMIDRNGWGVPFEVEVENHLVNKFFDDLAVMFPLVRICTPGNSQEKHAEHFNKAKKYGTEKKTQTSIGRWWAKSEAYRTKSNKVNDEYVERSFDYDTLVADDQAAVAEYNSQPHPKQKKYPGMTRWQVLCMHLNPDLPKPNRAAWIKSIGNHTETSIKRSRYVTVQYNEYELPSPDVLARLKPNNYSVDAYWLPDAEGNIREIYLYQHGEYISKAAYSDTFNTAKAERTSKDEQVRQGQAKYTAKFDKMVEAGRAAKVTRPVIIPASSISVAQAVTPQTVESMPVSKEFDIDAAMQKYGASEVRERAFNDI